MNYDQLNVFQWYEQIILFSVSQSKPTISLQKEIVLNEGDPLEITCTGLNPIKFIYPDIKGDEVYIYYC